MVKRRGSLALIFCLISQEVLALGLGLRFGPVSGGSGGSNPLAIPPSGSQMQLSLVTASLWDYSLSLTGIVVSKRQKTSWGGYASLGGGLLISSNSGGFGPSMAFGWEKGCGSWVGCFSLELTQSFSIASRPIAPSALRMGIMKWF